MSTFDTLQTMILDDLRELQRMRKRGWFVFSMARAVKEEHLGRCCYLAEEFLLPTDLCLFKSKLGLDERQWRVYKARISAQ